MSKCDEEGQPADFMKALWFRRCGVDPKKCNDEKNFSWPKTPAFELYMSSSGRIADDLEVESFLLEVEDADLTEAGLAQKLKTPKFTVRQKVAHACGEVRAARPTHRWLGIHRERQ